MAYDRDQFNERAKQLMQERQVSASLQLLHAAVPLEKLTNSPEWDSFLQLVQGFIEQDEKAYAVMADKLASPQLVNHDALIVIKMQMAVLQARLGLAKHLMDLPKQIIDSAHAHEPKVSG